MLSAASLMYGLGVWVRNRQYDRRWRRIESVSAPVISVGNLTVGGTGKTPCVEYVARYLSDLGHRVTILSRGFGANGGPNDEAMLLEENLPDVPHLIGADRVALARAAIEELESEVLVLDDGFQHRRLDRSVDLVLIDATEPWGYGSLLPRGLLREPPRELRRASAVILSRCDLAPAGGLNEIRTRISRLAPRLPVMESEHRPIDWINGCGQRISIDQFGSVRGAAFCGIGNPDGFFAALVNMGIDVVDRRAYPDHHRYTRADVEELEQWAESLPPDAVVLTTQKDMVKLRLPNLGCRALWALRVGLFVREGESELRQILENALK